MMRQIFVSLLFFIFGYFSLTLSSIGAVKQSPFHLWKAQGCFMDAAVHKMFICCVLQLTKQCTQKRTCTFRVCEVLSGTQADCMCRQVAFKFASQR